MMSILPRDIGICTRLAIHVRLRNSENAQPPKMEVFNLKTQKTEEGPFIIPIQWGDVAVRDKMREILERERPQHVGVSDERIIIVWVQGPLLPSIDLVDLPGLVASPHDLEVQTRTLVERHVGRHHAYSMYLLVVHGNENPRNSLAVKLVERLGLQDRTLGVFTMCDEIQPRMLDAFRRHLADASGPGPGEGLRLVPHGWVATSNRPVDGCLRSLERLRAQVSPAPVAAWQDGGADCLATRDRAPRRRVAAPASITDAPMAARMRPGHAECSCQRGRLTVRSDS